MLIEVDIELNAVNSNVAKAVYCSLKPDNVLFPNGMKMRMTVKGLSLYLSFYSKGKIDTLISTLNEVLENIHVSTNTINKVNMNYVGH